MIDDIRRPLHILVEESRGNINSCFDGLKLTPPKLIETHKAFIESRDDAINEAYSYLLDNQVFIIRCSYCTAVNFFLSGGSDFNTIFIQVWRVVSSDLAVPNADNTVYKVFLLCIDY